VHAIPELGEVSMLHDLSRAVGDLASKTGRQLHLVLENDDNAAGLLDADQDPPRGKYRAQWNDDYHHAWHVLLTGESHGYYSDYGKAPLRDIARSLASGFVYQGEASAHRGGQLRGEPSGALAPTSFVNFLQNHDQIGNRALGDRLESLAEDKAIEAALAITLLAPMIPMLFMGEEWGSTAPFPFFCDFQGDLADAVRNGRRKEFAGAYAKYGDEVPDPLDEATFRSTVLDWNARDLPKAHRRLRVVRDLLSVRRREIVPRLAGARFGDASAEDNGLLSAHWGMADGASLQLWANLSGQVIDFQTEITGTKIWGGDLSDVISPWAVHWHIGQR
jgi:malto-oligosyltrehalose trehalohydrolase